MKINKKEPCGYMLRNGDTTIFFDDCRFDNKVRRVVMYCRGVLIAAIWDDSHDQFKKEWEKINE